MHFDTALNCAWLLLGTVALASTLRTVRSGRKRVASVSAWLQLVGVASVVLALFPYISATDDVLRIANAVPQKQQSESGQRPPNGDLVRLFEAADTPLISQICTLTVTFIFFCLVSAPVKGLLRRSIPLQSGRSPPACFASI